MKKTLAMLLALVMMLSMLAACGSPAGTQSPPSQNSGEPVNSDNPGSTPEQSSAPNFAPMKIAFATSVIDESFANIRNAYENVIGPALNIEFTFSEQIADTGALSTFIENSYAAGCNGVISNVSNSIDQAAAICNDLGIDFVGVSSADAVENKSMPHYLSVVGASAEGYGQAYSTVLKSVVDDGNTHSVLILSGAACYGATSFIEGTAGSLQALAEVYGLTYEKDVHELATSSTQVDAENDKGIKITVFPGMADLATSVSPLLQTGAYDVIVGTNNIYDSLAVAVDEVEKALNMDIKFISRNTVSEAITNAVNSTDSQGSPVIDAMVAPGTYENIAAVIILRNAFDGYVDNMRAEDGTCSRIPGMTPLTITSPDEYNVLAADNMPYSFVTVEDILSLCGPNVTYKDIDAFGAGLTTENILKKFG